MNQRCYFHKTQPIQHFCSLKQCTLPLCQQCLQIHHQQHQDKCTSPSIIPYHQAYQQVLNSLTFFIQKAQITKQNYLKKLNHDKEQSIKTLEQYYSQYQNKIQQQSISLAQIQQRLKKLQKGSIKTVIYFYSGDISLKQFQYPEFQQISGSIQKCIKNLINPPKQEIQTFRQQLNPRHQNQLKQITNIQYETKQKNNSKKKLIFSNQKYEQSSHKNTNLPYLQNPKKDQNNFFKISQQQNKNLQQQRSQVKNYFDNENQSRQNFIKNKQFQPNPTFFMQKQQNNRVLKQTSIIPNFESRQMRSKTFNKFPSMAEFKIPKQNVYQPLPRNQQNKKMGTINVDFRPGKWNKEKLNQQKNPNNNEKFNSIYSQFTVTDPTQNQSNQLFIQEEFQNKQPLKTTDLDTYTPLNDPIPVFQSRQRAFSYEPGLRTTVSHNNLTMGRKVEPILGDQLKKNVLSPQEIRKMLEKKIEERNKVLIQKKQHQLKINTDRRMSNKASLNLRGDQVQKMEQKTENFLREEQKMFLLNRKDVNFEDQDKRQQQRSGFYNTRDSIINQIYRETRY